jgi:hypothetical protein
MSQALAKSTPGWIDGNVKNGVSPATKMRTKPSNMVVEIIKNAGLTWFNHPTLVI